MEYALKVLNRYGPAVRVTSFRKHFVEEVPCAYCGGAGADPKYGGASGCPVCRGAGRVPVAPPVVACRPCAASGRMAGDLICLTCRGVGMLPVRHEADICPSCRGSGEAGIFPCSACKGQGIV
jgi:DnaJ-class molecular chaperone